MEGCAHHAAAFLGRGGGFGFGFPFLGGIFWLLLLGVLIFVVVMIARRTPMTRPWTGYGQSPLDVAKSRYAKGEINKEEYEALRKDLE
jgi:putative membrane protein